MVVLPMATHFSDRKDIMIMTDDLIDRGEKFEYKVAVRTA